MRTEGHRLDQLGVDDIVTITHQVRRLTVDDGACMLEIADRVVRHLEQALVDHEGKPAAAGVHLQLTCLVRELDAWHRQAASSAAHGVSLEESTRCLVLMATAGRGPFVDRGAGLDVVLPLSHELLADRPMLAGTVASLGVQADAFVRPGLDDLRALQDHRFGVHFVPNLGSVPSLDAASRFHLSAADACSLIACGGTLLGADVFVLTVLTSVPVSAAVADLFSTLAVGVKAALMPYALGPFPPS